MLGCVSLLAAMGHNRMPRLLVNIGPIWPKVSAGLCDLPAGVMRVLSLPSERKEGGCGPRADATAVVRLQFRSTLRAS